MKDDKIIRSLRTNPEETLTALMTEHMGLVCTIVKARISGIGSKEDIEDCISEVFLELWRQRKSLDPEKGTVKAYLCAIAAHKATEFYRKKVSSGEAVSLDEEEWGEYSDGFSLENAILSKETREELLAALQKLDMPDREIILRRFFLREKSKSVAERLGMTVSAIDTRTHRALKKLKELLGGKNESKSN